MHGGGYSTSELKQAGFAVKTLRLSTGVSVKGLLDVGFKVAALRAGG